MKVAVIYNKRTADLKDVINIFGPQTRERYNPKTVELVASSLEKGGHNVKKIEGNIDVAASLKDFMPRVMAGERPGMVFNMAYGIQGQSRYTHIPAVLEMLGVPYVGSGPQAHAVALDKVMTKIVLQQHGLSTPDFWFFNGPDDEMDHVTFPVIVKPKMEAVSMGMKVVDNVPDLREAVGEIVEAYQQQALVEAFISGREFAVGLLGNGADQQVLPIVEFDLRGDPDAIQTQDAKLHAPLEKICPAEVDEKQAEKLRELARGAFNALECHDFARVDFRMDAKGNIYILELNSMASLGHTGSYVHAAHTAGYTYETLVNRMLDVAAIRNFGEDYAPDGEEGAALVQKKQPLRVRLRSYLRSNSSTFDDYLEHMVELNTHTHNTEGVNTLGEWISGRMTRLGFERNMYPQVQIGNILGFANHDDSQHDILLLGHLDTHFGHEDYFPFHEDRGRFYGPGVAESKGGLAVMLAALQALRYTRRLKKVKIGVLLTTDDNLGGHFSWELVSDYARRSRYVVGLKWGESDGGIVTSCYGRKNFEVEMNNVKTVGREAPDVILAMNRKISAWQRLSNPKSGTLVKTYAMEARSLYGQAPDYARASLYVQFSTRDQGERLEKRIREIARKDLGRKLQARVKKDVHRPPVEESQAGMEFFERVRQAARDLSIKVKAAHRFNSSDICYVPQDTPVLGGFGPIGEEIRTARENIVRDSVVDRAALLALVISRSVRED